MNKKRVKRRRNTYLILAFFVLLWLGLSVPLYLRGTDMARLNLLNAMDGNVFVVSVMVEESGYRYVINEFDTSELGFFQIRLIHEWYETRNREILKEKWRFSTFNVQLSADVDRERIFDEGFAAIVAEGHVPNLPTITRVEAEDFEVVYPDRIAKIKRAIAKEAFGVTALGVFVLCGFVLVARFACHVVNDRPRPGVCPDCDYNLGGLESQQCPECGRGFSDKEWRFHMSE